MNVVGLQQRYNAWKIQNIKIQNYGVPGYGTV
jgi:hypothetical protein